jgi:hypothetical protein
MSSSAQKYIIKARENRYAPEISAHLKDKFYTDTSKSKERKVVKSGLEEYLSSSNKTPEIYKPVPAVGLENGNILITDEYNPIYL